MSNTAELDIKKWIEQYSEKLLNRAYFLLSDKEVAADVVQDVFVAAYQGYEKFRSESNVLTWLFGILNNKVAGYYRNKYKTPPTISLDHFFDESGAWKKDSFANNQMIETQNYFDKESTMHSLEQCIEMLPPRWKIAVKLYYLMQKKSKEVCQEMKITTTNLWKLLQRSRMQLRACLQEDERSKKTI